MLERLHAWLFAMRRSRHRKIWKQLLILCLSLAVADCGAGAALALGGSNSAAANAELRSHAVMVLGSRGSACSGTLIARNAVLTAGHCVDGSSALAIAYFEGSQPILKAARSAVKHPRFSLTDNRSIDLALVRLSEPLPARFTPAAMEGDEIVEPAPGPYILAGFGLQQIDDPKSAGTLRSAELTALGISTSRMMHLTTEPESVRICRGDSGGPVFSSEARGILLVGVIIATYSPNLKRGTPGARVCGNIAQVIRLGPQRDWIDQVLAGWK
jgi:secreted trypsin-like serine protease